MLLCELKTNVKLVIVEKRTEAAAKEKEEKTGLTTSGCKSVRILSRVKGRVTSPTFFFVGAASVNVVPNVRRRLARSTENEIERCIVL